MKKTMKSLILSMTVLILILSLIIGCGQKGDVQKSDGPEETDGDATTQTETQADGPEEEQVIVFYGFSEWLDDPDIREVYDELAEEFAELNPGFTIDFQSDPWSDWETKYKAMFASGNVPDVFYVNNPDFPVFANGGYLLDIGEVTGDDYFEDYFPGVTNMYKWDDKHMAIPFTTDCRVLWYNKEIFEKAGLDPEKPPTTWPELKEAAEKCTMDLDGDGKIDVYGFGVDLGANQETVSSLLCASPGSVIEIQDDGSINPTVNTPEFKGYYQLFKDMKPYFQPDFSSLNHLETGTLFAQQKVAMTIAGFWVWDQNEHMADETFYGHTLIPKMDESSPDGSFGGGFGISVSKNTANPEKAIEFAKMLCAPENNYRVMTDVPASQKGLEASPYAEDDKYKVFMEQIVFGRQPYPKTLYDQDIQASVYDELMKVIIDDSATVDQSVLDLEAKILDIVK